MGVFVGVTVNVEVSVMVSVAVSVPVSVTVAVIVGVSVSCGVHEMVGVRVLAGPGPVGGFLHAGSNADTIITQIKTQ
jgi:hypothetical protein